MLKGRKISKNVIRRRSHPGLAVPSPLSAEEVPEMVSKRVVRVMP